MDKHLADISGVSSYKVRLEFTDVFEPSMLSGDGLPYVSIEDEIEANSVSQRSQKLRELYKRIPYGSTLYFWESETGGVRKILYVGQTMLLPLQKRFEGHGALVKLLADHVNLPESRVYFRLCSRLDLTYDSRRGRVTRAIEHFPLNQARKIVDDLEAYVIFNVKPPYNKQYKNKEKLYGLPFSIESTKNFFLK